MNTRITTKIKGVVLTMGLGVLSFAGISQEHITMSMENITSTKSTIEYDLYIVNDGSTAIKLAGCAFGINYNPVILNGGNPGEAAHNVAANSRTRALNTLSNYSLLSTNRDNFHQLRMTTKPARIFNAVELQANVPYKVGHFVFTNNTNWASNSNPAFDFNVFSVPGISTTCATGYVDASTNPIGFSVAKKNLSVKMIESPVLNPSSAMPQLGNDQHTASSSSVQNDQTNSSVINVYPNPTQDVVNIDLTATEVGNTTVKVSDIRGRVVKQIQARSEKGLNTMTISLREVPAGNYNVQVFQNNVLSFTGKVTKKD